jgi:hypothetical protein
MPIRSDPLTGLRSDGLGVGERAIGNLLIIIDSFQALSYNGA